MNQKKDFLDELEQTLMLIMIVAAICADADIFYRAVHCPRFCESV